MVGVYGVTRRYGELKALDNVELLVNKGDFFGFVGPNGEGKSNLLRILTGQIASDSGSIDVLGLDGNDPVKLRSRVGIVPESETPPSFLNTEEYLQLVCRIR